MSHRCVCVGFTLLMCLSLACSKSGGGAVKLGQVKGKVTFLGKPVEGAIVSFNAEGAPRFAVGETDVEGNYRLSMFDKNDGAVVGQNTVTITGAAASEPVTPTGADDYGKAMGIGAGNAPKIPQNAKVSIPAKYADLKRGLLKVNVQDGANEHDFKLQE